MASWHLILSLLSILDLVSYDLAFSLAIPPDPITNIYFPVVWQRDAGDSTTSLLDRKYHYPPPIHTFGGGSYFAYVNSTLGDSVDPQATSLEVTTHGFLGPSFPATPASLSSSTSASTTDVGSPTTTAKRPSFGWDYQLKSALHAIAGAVVGGILSLVLIAISGFFFFSRTRRSRKARDSSVFLAQQFETVSTRHSPSTTEPFDWDGLTVLHHASGVLDSGVGPSTSNCGTEPGIASGTKADTERPPPSYDDARSGAGVSTVSMTPGERESRMKVYGKSAMFP
ncbi:hypothetical protein GGU11DRAFT_805778 [Lentinula aff. detonsa]|nr:hypothetical protein GGU11DRAFT_805778 [Lentinula aff. detonsa]